MKFQQFKRLILIISIICFLVPFRSFCNTLENASNILNSENGNKQKIEQLSELISPYDVVSLCKFISFSPQSNRNIVQDFFLQNQERFTTYLNDISIPTIKRYNLYSFLKGYTDLPIERIDEVFNLTNLIPNISEIDPQSEEDFLALQEKIHSAYLVLRFSLLDEDVFSLKRSVLTEQINNFHQEAVNLDNELHSLLGLERSEEYRVIRRDVNLRRNFQNRLYLTDLIKQRFQDLINLLNENHLLRQNQESVIPGYNIDLKTGVITLTASNNLDLGQVAEYWTGNADNQNKLLPLLRNFPVQENNKIIINGLLSPFFQSRINSFLFQQSFTPNIDQSQGANCFDCTIRFHSGDIASTDPMTELYEIKEYLEDNYREMEFHYKNLSELLTQLHPGDVIVFMNTTKQRVPLIPNNSWENGLPTQPTYNEDQFELRTEIFHASTYLINGYTFSKQNFMFSSPYLIKTLDYETNLCLDDTLQLRFYRPNWRR